MATIRVVQCLLFMASTALVIEATNSPKHVTVDAAMFYPTFPYNIHLYIKGQELVIPTQSSCEGQDNSEAYVSSSCNYLRPDMDFTAAYAEHKNGAYVGHFFGETYKQDTSSIGSHDFGSDYDFIKGVGADAIAKRGDKVIFFKGCKMAARNALGDWEEPEDIKPIGLPCHPDAAWEQNTMMIILRGDQIWKWKEDGTVDGPHPFHDTYSITSWILKPYEVSCPKEWILYKDLNMCYSVIKTKLTWPDARTACQAKGGDLVTIKDKETMDFINGLLDNAYYWLGLNDVLKEGTFVWLDETEEATFTHWLSGEPNDYKCNEDCGHITWKKFWNDRPCEAKLRYICQVPATRG